MNCIFSLSVSSSSSSSSLSSSSAADYSFFTDRTDEGDWSVGCLIMVLLIRLLTKHIHKTNVALRGRSVASGLLSSLFDYGDSLQYASAGRRSRHVDLFFALFSRRYTSRKLVELLLYLNRRFQLLKVQLETLPEDELINK